MSSQPESPNKDDKAAVKEEKEARKAARQERRMAKEQEQQKKEAVLAKQKQAVDKQKQAMSSFFKTPAPATSRQCAAGPSTKREPTDFERTFKPIVQRPNIEWAAINRWVSPRRRSLDEANEVSGPTSVEFVEWAKDGAPEIAGLDARDEHLKRHKRRKLKARTSLPIGLKSAPLHGSVQDVWEAHQEANDPRKVLDQLRNRRKFPWKVLAFDGQVRPPYSGTFTKKSVVVGARTPFAQDPIFDYSYDSGDDWQDEEGGDDVDEPEVEKAEEEGDDESIEEEGEFDDWLDDSEDAGFVPMDVDEDPLARPPLPQLDQGRLPMKIIKKRDVVKKVVKVMPSWRGPEWESRIGKGTKGLEEYRIQLLNDTPFSVDPFTWSAPDPAQYFTATYSTSIIGSSASVRTLLSTSEKQVRPPPPPPSATTLNDSRPIVNGSPTPLTALATNGEISQSRPAGPKTAFPAAHLPELLRLIEGNTKIRTDLISQLRDHFEKVATKGSIEAKIKEVAVREGKSKHSAWRVRQEAWTEAGTPPPVSLCNAEHMTSMAMSIDA